MTKQYTIFFTESVRALNARLARERKAAQRADKLESEEAAAAVASAAAQVKFDQELAQKLAKDVAASTDPDEGGDFDDADSMPARSPTPPKREYLYYLLFSHESRTFNKYS